MTCNVAKGSFRLPCLLCFESTRLQKAMREQVYGVLLAILNATHFFVNQRHFDHFYLIYLPTSDPSCGCLLNLIYTKPSTGGHECTTNMINVICPSMAQIVCVEDNSCHR